MLKAIGFMFLIGCGGSEVLDTGPDGGNEPDSNQALGGPVGLADGSYELEWGCEEGCLYNAPFKAGLDGLEVAGGRITYTSSCCTLVTEQSYDGTPDGDCLVFDGLHAGGEPVTSPYSFCPAVGGPTATIEWTTYAEQPVRYALRAVPR